MSLQDLPSELLLHILFSTDTPSSLWALARTCRRIYSIFYTSQAACIYHVLAAELGPVLSDALLLADIPPDEGDWRAFNPQLACWDGKNLDSPDHKSHVAYPVAGAQTFTGSSVGGACPSTHPVKIPQIMLEIVWDTTAFNNKAEWPADGSQPFVLSTGDTTGYGQHGDYVFGWKGDSLQRAMDGGCLGASCADLKTQSNEEAARCSVPGRVKEDFDGWLDKLPGEVMPM